MDLLIGEAKLIGFKEGFKIGIVWLVFYTYLYLNNSKAFIRPFYLGLFFACLISGISLFLPHGIIARDLLTNIIATSFALFLLSSVFALFQASRINLFGTVQKITQTWVINTIVFSATLVFFAPDITGAVFFLEDLSLLKGSEFIPYVNAFFGLFVAFLIVFLFFKFYKPYWIGSYFNIPQLLLFLATVKLLGSGIRGFVELSLIPSVQRGFMKFTHDLVHQVLLLFMVPDHPLLKTTVWDFIGIFFGSNIASISSLILLLLLPFIFIYYSLFKPISEPEAQSGAQRRKIKSLIILDRRRKALPVIFFIGFILIAWFSQSSESVSQIYKPKPRPVVVDKGTVIIPLNDPTMDLMDGTLHKFSLIHQGEEIRIIIIKKSDDSLSVCLDACEICRTDGYGQRDHHVVCLYCNTPIPVDTLSIPGGCNPIPLTADIDGRFVRIELSEILKKRGFVMSGMSNPR